MVVVGLAVLLPGKASWARPAGVVLDARAEVQVSMLPTLLSAARALDE